VLKIPSQPSLSALSLVMLRLWQCCHGRTMMPGRLAVPPDSDRAVQGGPGPRQFRMSPPAGCRRGCTKVCRPRGRAGRSRSEPAWLRHFQVHLGWRPGEFCQYRRLADRRAVRACRPGRVREFNRLTWQPQPDSDERLAASLPFGPSRRPVTVAARPG
jgi:hypothetical protein